MIWLVGSGLMSIDYAKVLESQQHDYLVIGRGKRSATDFTAQTGKEVIQGGLESFLDSAPELPKAAIVSVGVAQLYETTLALIEAGVKKILVEKPGGMSQIEVDTLHQRSQTNACKVYIAYNRRFFSSVLALENKIKEEGGVTSFNFELTEWAHVIEKIDKPESALKKWFLANSTHVADLAFYLGGRPKELASFVQGKLAWHPAASVFSGAGISDSGALFNYAANWESAGRWSVEVLTKENRYILRPIETLQVQRRGTIPIVDIDIDNSLDLQFKPGLYKQVESFLSGDDKFLCKIEEQVLLFSTYEKMAGYL
ncbi:MULTISPECIES: gfo/Idh/MocA family oxidoreductase [Vibrio]|uniref:gfo/Idh/MocA family oxidoreductase n=1 Tax=Vibrio TaxID=662 RepID=UPI002075C67D|nr:MULTISPECIES: gfo/Idh/MocA family oxidoreductase [Vibrio]USD32714.1 gfo/Idh/MocA family oxidoreductase [Vibrio sp. SCSIO 43186]USD45754.1 gfo/Idh/MocA family oxidoreductase [Vibrio sp. SCSIO 43145]USD69839.1 gfo/Idh/MocA family oxidoreductase [Vibrio sp. SCSIO 43139]USD94746.1 myo-inositol 2-dehydrogenase [Vibrio coralliilyticus]